MKKSISAGTVFAIIAMIFVGLLYIIAAGNPFYGLVPAAFVSAWLTGSTAWLIFRGERSSFRALLAGTTVGCLFIPLAWFLVVFWKFVITAPTTSTDLTFFQAMQGAFNLGVSSWLKLIWYTIPAGALTGPFIRLRFFPMMP